jgi:hypothetical protein
LVATRLAIIERDGYIEPGGKVEAWFRWAGRVAESIDPLRKIHEAANGAESNSPMMPNPTRRPK